MAVDMVFKIGDIKGESIVDKHEDEIQVLTWSWGMTQGGTTHMGTGGGAGKVNVQDISFTKYIDKASPILMLYCCKGTHIPEAILTLRKAGGDKPVEFVVIKLNNILISSVSTGGGAAEERLTETVTLNFANVNVAYQEQGRDGAPKGGKIEMSWDIPIGK